jgi:tetratricopeptide (TPR) repeat protein
MRRHQEAFAMKRKFPLWIFSAIVLFAAPFYLRAQQGTPSQAAGNPPAQYGNTSQSTLSPKALQEERAKVQLAEKRYDAAIQSYQDLLRADPKNAGFMNMIGIAYLDLSNFDQARRYFLRASRADKKNSSAVNNLGMVYYHQKDFKRAIREYQRAVTIDPSAAGAHTNLGFAYYNTNKFPEAAAEFQKAIEIDPAIFERNDRSGNTMQDRSVSNHGLFFFTMAKVYAQKKDAAHCADYLRKSLDEGYKGVAKAATDPAFKDVIDDPAVQAVMLRAVPAEQKASETRPGA